MTRIGLALGGGGVRGLAHVCVLERLDRLGMRPSLIAGCSMGAIIGALYAAGWAGRAIHELIDTHTIHRKDTWRDILHKGPAILKWAFALTPTLRHGGLLNVDRLLDQLLGSVAKADFAELEIPLVVVATDFRSAEQVVLSTGPIQPAVRASLAVPGLFAPVKHDGRILVDGGLVNQVPFDLLIGKTDFTIAVDVGSGGIPGEENVPSASKALLRAVRIMQFKQLGHKLERGRPDILLQPEMGDIGLYDIHRVEEILRNGEAACADLDRRLGALGTGPPAAG